MHQHAQYISHMGDDNAIANAARISMDKLSEMFTDKENESLIYFLARGISSKEYQKRLDAMNSGGYLSYEEVVDIYNSIKNTAVHWTPFAHTSISLRMNAPVPIRTQCFKHKQGFVENEESRRYISSTPVFYIPEYFRSVPEGSIKQGSGDTHQNSDFWRNAYIKHCDEAIKLYCSMIDAGVCPEQARFALPQGTIVNWIWTGNVFSFANFVNKRRDPHAQKEIQVVAQQVSDIIAPLYPVAWSALTS